MGLGVNQILRQIYENGTKIVLIWVVIHLSDKQFICKTALDYKYIVLDVLVHSITSIVTSCAVFWLALQACENTNNKWKYSAIQHTKMSSKLLIIQLLFFC